MWCDTLCLVRGGCCFGGDFLLLFFLTEPNIFKIQPCCTMYPYFIPFYCWTIFPYMVMPHFFFKWKGNFIEAPLGLGPPVDKEKVGGGPLCDLLGAQVASMASSFLWQHGRIGEHTLGEDHLVAGVFLGELVEEGYGRMMLPQRWTATGSFWIL